MSTTIYASSLSEGASSQYGILVASPINYPSSNTAKIDCSIRLIRPDGDTENSSKSITIKVLYKKASSSTYTTVYNESHTIAAHANNILVVPSLSFNVDRLLANDYNLDIRLEISDSGITYSGDGILVIPKISNYDNAVIKIQYYDGIVSDVTDITDVVTDMPEDQEYYITDDVFVISSIIPKRLTYEFDHWKSQKGTNFDPEETIDADDIRFLEIKAGVKLTAVWTKNENSIYYLVENAEDYYNIPETQKITNYNRVSVNKPRSAIHSELEFSTWTDIDGNQYDSGSIISRTLTKDLILYANFVPKRGLVVIKSVKPYSRYIGNNKILYSFDIDYDDSEIGSNKIISFQMNMGIVRPAIAEEFDITQDPITCTNVTCFGINVNNKLWPVQGVVDVTKKIEPGMYTGDTSINYIDGYQIGSVSIHYNILFIDKRISVYLIIDRTDMPADISDISSLLEIDFSLLCDALNTSMMLVGDWFPNGQEALILDYNKDGDFICQTQSGTKNDNILAFNKPVKFYGGLMDKYGYPIDGLDETPQYMPGDEIDFVDFATSGFITGAQTKVMFSVPLRKRIHDSVTSAVILPSSANSYDTDTNDRIVKALYVLCKGEEVVKAAGTVSYSPPYGKIVSDITVTSTAATRYSEARILSTRDILNIIMYVSDQNKIPGTGTSTLAYNRYPAGIRANFKIKFK